MTNYQYGLPFSNVNEPANTSAAISPTEKPAVAIHELSACGLVAFNFSRHANDVTSTAGWQKSV